MKLRIVHLFFVTLIGAWIFGFTYLPLQDYPNLLYQGFVFNQYYFHLNNFGDFFHVHRYLPPNMASTVILGSMDALLDTFVAGKVFLFFLAAALYFGCFRYLSFHLSQRRIIFAIVAFFLAINFHFLMGYLNFLVGFALTVNIIVFIRQRRLERNLLVLGLSMLIIYFCHFVALILFCLYFITYFIAYKKYKSIFHLTLSGVPTLSIFIHYVASRTIPILYTETDNRTWFDVIKGKFIVFFAPILPFHNFKWVYEPSLGIKSIDYLFCVIAFILLIYIAGKNVVYKNLTFEFILALASIALAFFLPLYFGGVLLPGERFVVFAILNIFVLGYRNNIYRPVRNCSFILSTILVLFTYSYIMWNTNKFDSMIKKNDIPEEAILHPQIKQEGINGFTHVHFYEDIRLKRAVPFFNTGLFSYPDSLAVH